MIVRRNDRIKLGDSVVAAVDDARSRVEDCDAGDSEHTRTRPTLVTGHLPAAS